MMLVDLPKKTDTKQFNTYVVVCKNGDKYTVKAKCYFLNFYSWFQFVLYDHLEVSKSIRSQGVLPVEFEIPKREVANIFVEGAVEKTIKPRKTRTKVKSKFSTRKKPTQIARKNINKKKRTT